MFQVNQNALSPIVPVQNYVYIYWGPLEYFTLSWETYGVHYTMVFNLGKIGTAVLNQGPIKKNTDENFVKETNTTPYDDGCL